MNLGQFSLFHFEPRSAFLRISFGTRHRLDGGTAFVLTQGMARAKQVELALQNLEHPCASVSVTCFYFPLDAMGVGVRLIGWLG